MVILYAFIFALFNRLRGWSFIDYRSDRAPWYDASWWEKTIEVLISKGVMSLAMGFSLILYIPWLECLVYSVGFYLLFVLGWGRGFSATHGDLSGTNDKFPFDGISRRFFDPLDPDDAKFYGTLWMSVRWVLCGIPLIAALVWFNGFIGLLMLPMLAASGPVLYLAAKIKETRCIEIWDVAMGALLGGVTFWVIIQ